MLVGDKPVRSKLTLTTVPASTPLRPLRLDLVAAPPDIPCAHGRDRADVQSSGRTRQRRATFRSGSRGDGRRARGTLRQKPVGSARR